MLPGKSAEHQSSRTGLVLWILVLVQNREAKALSTHSEGEIDVMGENCKEEELGKGVHGARLGVDAVPQGR